MIETFRAREDHAPHFHRGQPGEVQVGGEVLLVPNVEVRDVAEAARIVAAPGRLHARGLGPNHEVQDGEIVGSQVPDHVDIGLE